MNLSVWTGPVEPEEGGFAYPDFGRSVNPILTKGADYAYHTTTFPSSGFSDLPSALQYLEWFYAAIQNMLSDGAKIVASKECSLKFISFLFEHKP